VIGTDSYVRSPEPLRLGSRFATRGRTVTESDLVAFAALTGDWHPQHSDAAWASRSEFGERIAHGMLVVSYAFGLLPLDPERVLALRALREVVFKRPVRIGETIAARGEVVAIKPLGELALATIALRIVDSAERTAVRLRVDIVIRVEIEEM
jgi:3-hydroxybutyryl-CoA dehydratase